jgi:hypothetical protein
MVNLSPRRCRAIILRQSTPLTAPPLSTLSLNAVAEHVAELLGAASDTSRLVGQLRRRQTITETWLAV